MMSPKLHRNVTIFARISAGQITGASLAFFIVILVKVLDDRFPASGEGYSVMPVLAVRPSPLLLTDMSQLQMPFLQII